MQTKSGNCEKHIQVNVFPLRYMSEGITNKFNDQEATSYFRKEEIILLHVKPCIELMALDQTRGVLSTGHNPIPNASFESPYPFLNQR